MPFMAMVHEDDPRAQIFKQVGFDKKTQTIPGFKLMKNDVLCGVYERPEKTKSGIIITEQTRAEDRSQGKAALVLMKGPTAYVSDKHYTFTEDQNVDVGEWVAMWVTDGRRIMINGQLCRIVRDVDVLLKIPSPDSVY